MHWWITPRGNLENSYRIMEWNKLDNISSYYRTLATARYGLVAGGSNCFMQEDITGAIQQRNRRMELRCLFVQRGCLGERREYEYGEI
jgi:guanylate kinase